MLSDLESANAVAYNADTSARAKAVTLDGDICDPAGTVTGGSRPSNTGILVQLAQLTEARQTLHQCEAELGNLSKQIDDLATAGDRYRQLQQQLELAAHRYELAQVRAQGSTYHKLQAEVVELQTQLTELQQAVIMAQQAEREAIAKGAELEKEMKSAEKSARAGVKEIQQRLVVARKARDEAQKRQRAKDQASQQISAEIGM